MECGGYGCVLLCKKKTADEMRISDGSSDVCSSDLEVVRTDRGGVFHDRPWLLRVHIRCARPLHQHERIVVQRFGNRVPDRVDLGADHIPDLQAGCMTRACLILDRKSTRLNSSH